ncbi:MAG: hypothetical protein JXC36_08655 [Candidatus Atribacteria bacterium]|nr:hypothetical protein [Candidatus Atribacteria bacterium]
MENKKGLSIVLLIPTIIIGVALFEEFDFENLKFEKPALAFVYFIGFALSIIFQFKAFKRLPKDKNIS